MDVSQLLISTVCEPFTVRLTCVRSCGYIRTYSTPLIVLKTQMVIKQLLWRMEHHLRKLPSTTQSELLPYSALHHAGEWVGLFTWNFKWHAGETSELSFLWGKKCSKWVLPFLVFFHCLAGLCYSFLIFMHKKTLHEGGHSMWVFFVCFTPFVVDEWSLIDAFEHEICYFVNIVVFCCIIL